MTTRVELNKIEISIIEMLVNGRTLDVFWLRDCVPDDTDDRAFIDAVSNLVGLGYIVEATPPAFHFKSTWEGRAWYWGMKSEARLNP